MEETELNKSKVWKIIIKIIVVLVLIAVVCLVYNIRSGKFLPDNERFSKEYAMMSENNIFKYATKTEIKQAFESETAIIFFGFPTCKWCQEYVKGLNDIAMQNGIKEIYYYNIKNDRKNNSDFYNFLVSQTKEYLDYDDDGNLKIFVPDTYFIKNGKIIGHNNDVQKSDEIENYIKEIITNNCDDSKKGC